MASSTAVLDVDPHVGSAADGTTTLGLVRSALTFRYSGVKNRR
jgi:hypothetical protein